MINENDIKEVACSFLTFDSMYDQIVNGEYRLNRKAETNEFPEIIWLTEYFLENEEYEKCEFLSKLQLPMVDNNQIEIEINKLAELK